MAAVMNAQRGVPTTSRSTGKAATRVAFAPSSIRGNALRAVSVRATRQQINTVCKAVVSVDTRVIWPTWPRWWFWIRDNAPCNDDSN